MAAKANRKTLLDKYRRMLDDGPHRVGGRDCEIRAFGEYVMKVEPRIPMPSPKPAVVETEKRVRREVPRHLVLHYADLATADVWQVEGIPVTTPERAIGDVHAAHIGPALVRQAIEDGRRSGLLSIDAADRLERELLGTEPKKGRGAEKPGKRVRRNAARVRR